MCFYLDNVDKLRNAECMHTNVNCNHFLLLNRCKRKRLLEAIPRYDGNKKELHRFIQQDSKSFC